MTVPHLLIPCRARLPSLSEVTDYLEGHGWTPIPPPPGRWDCWEHAESGMQIDVQRAETPDWRRRASELLSDIAVIEGRAVEDIARDLDLFEVLP